MSNVKAGDLAVIVRSAEKRNLGKFVKVLRRMDTISDSWWVISNAVLHGFQDWPPGSEVGTYDACLRPIRDPGEDAQDQTLQWLDVPSAEKVDA